MGFVITKILLYLVLPPASLIMLMLAGLWLVNKHKNVGKLFILAGITLLYLLSLDPVTDALIRPLETAYPPFHAKPVKADAIVVLSGGVKDLSWLPSEPEPSELSLERIVMGIRLYRMYHLPLVITGGTGETAPTAAREADAMADIALELGVPRKDVIVESRSRNTLENAEAVKKVLKGMRILLVTSAFHLKRSTALFEKQGFTVIPVPAGYRSGHTPSSLVVLIPRTGNLATSATAISEHLSLTWYGITGKL